MLFGVPMSDAQWTKIAGRKRSKLKIIERLKLNVNNKKMLHKQTYKINKSRKRISNTTSAEIPGMGMHWFDYFVVHFSTFEFIFQILNLCSNVRMYRALLLFVQTRKSWAEGAELEKLQDYCAPTQLLTDQLVSVVLVLSEGCSRICVSEDG